MPAILLFSIQDILENAPSELIKVYLDLTYLLRLVIRAWEQALEQRTILQTQMNCRVFTSLVQWTWATIIPPDIPQPSNPIQPTMIKGEFWLVLKSQCRHGLEV